MVVIEPLAQPLDMLRTASLSSLRAVFATHLTILHELRSASSHDLSRFGTFCIVEPTVAIVIESLEEPRSHCRATLGPGLPAFGSIDLSVLIQIETLHALRPTLGATPLEAGLIRHLAGRLRSERGQQRGAGKKREQESGATHGWASFRGLRPILAS